MTQVLNGPIETALRVIALLDVYEDVLLSREQLIFLDHALIHSADYDGPPSLHPALPARESELTVKRSQVNAALQLLVRAGLAKVESRGSEVGVRIRGAWSSCSSSRLPTHVVAAARPLDARGVRRSKRHRPGSPNRAARGQKRLRPQRCRKPRLDYGGSMTSITLRSLVVVGRGVPPAVIEFGDDLTVIHGASDTGKSFVFNAIDYMLGGKSIRHVKGLDAYDTALLALTLTDGTEWTLSRGLKGGAFRFTAAFTWSSPQL